MDPVTLGVVALMGAVATIGGAAEDIESDLGSQSNPNSQVQLAPQMGHLHRMINKAASGEPVAYGVWCGVAGSIAYVLMSYFDFYPIISLAMGSCVAAFVHAIYTITAHMGRIVGQSQFEQPLFMDVLTESLGPIVGHGFITTFCLVGVSYLMTVPLNGTPLHGFPLPLLAVLWGITLGAIGSSTGDVHYGAESEYQKFEFGGGTPVAIQGDIVTKAPLGAKNSIDVGNFCVKFGGPLTGFCFGLVVFFSFWNSVVFGLYGGLVVGFIIVVILVLMNDSLERSARKKYGPYEEE